MRDAEGQTIRLADYRAPDFWIDSVDLDFDLNANATRVSATLAIRRDEQADKTVALDLVGDDLALTGLWLDGAPLGPEAYEATPARLRVFFPPDRPFTVRIETRLDPSANTKLMGLYRSGSAYCTQCEAEGFRRITYFLDRPDVMSVYRVRLEADEREAPVLLSNGNFVEGGKAKSPGRHYSIWSDPHKKPCYLFALVAGDLAAVRDHHVTTSGAKVDLAIYVEHGREARALYAMDSLKRSFAWDERAFGREYDLEQFNVVAVSDFNMGAMENKGLNVFNDKYVLAAPDTATDDDYAQIESVIGHEYFHNWTGNRITCRDWFQLCLKEGLTVFRDQEFSSDERSRAVKRIADVRTLRAAQFPEDSGPLAHSVRPAAYREINNFYTATVYQKGAEVIRMLKRIIGDESFKRGMDLYFARCDGTAATVEDFLACFAESSGRDLTQFKLWYEQAGTPRVTIRTAYADGVLTVRLSQSLAPTPGQPTKQAMPIPIALGLIDAQSGPLPLAAPEATADEIARETFVLDGPERTLRFTGLTRRPALSALRGFCAPVSVDDDLTDDDLAILARKDDDSFNRWQALQTQATRACLAGVAAIRLGSPRANAQRLADAFAATLADALAGRIDPAFAALALGLPTEADLAREIGADVDPDAIRAARVDLLKAIGAHNAPVLADIFARFGETGAFSPDAQAAGRRALKNAALHWLAFADPEQGGRLAEAQADQASNMTDRLAALGALVFSLNPRREGALARFAAAFAHEPLVMDKWFALSAMIPDDWAVARVRGLFAHPAFSFGNPNRVRSLIGSFTANPTQFNRPDGAGYALLAEIVLKLDPQNPQIAARLLTAMRTWRTFEPTRRAAAEAALRRIADAQNLSNDVRDIVTRSLG